MALPVWAEYMQKVYADTLTLGIYPETFNIPQSVDVLLDCGANDEGTIEYEEF
jgi:hypothetical protein